MLRREMKENLKMSRRGECGGVSAFSDDNGSTIVRLSATDSAPNARVELVMECSTKCVEIQFWTPLGHRLLPKQQNSPRLESGEDKRQAVQRQCPLPRVHPCSM